MSALTVLALYALALAGSSLLGGSLPRHFAMTHTRTQLAMSLVSGVMLGIAFLHLLPHAVLAGGGATGLSLAMSWAIIGLVVMLLLLRLLHFHQPDYPAEFPRDCDHAHDTQEHAHADAAPTVRWQGVLVGLVFHTFIDGVALGAAMLGAARWHVEALPGLGVFLAILLHKPLDAMSITALMKAGGASGRAQRLANVAFAAVCPFGALLFYLAVGASSELQTVVLAPVLAFTAGAFICIALGDLLPEVQFHSHDRIKLTVVFLLGIALAHGMEVAAPQHGHALLAPVSGS